MKRFFALAALCAFSCGLYAQVVDTTVCDVLKAPQSFDGKIVRIKGPVEAGFDQFAIKGTNCGQFVNAIWLAYPEGTKAKSGPVAVVEMQPAKNFAGTVAAPARTPVTLEKSKDFKQFDSLLSTPHKSTAMCLGCVRYAVTATIVGRLDGVANAAMTRNAAGKIVGLGGFGNMNAYSARLVIQSVSDVTPQEIDYSASDAATKADTPAVTPGSAPVFSVPDPVGDAHKAATALGATSVFGVQIERAVAVYGKSGERNGVTLGYGATNEAAAKNEAQGKNDSPDGVLYNCAFNQNRLQGDALDRAVLHIGNLIADIRTPEQGSEKADLFEVEYRAWTTTVVDSVANGQKTLTLPGGYVIWNMAWPEASRNQELSVSLTKFLSTHESLTR